jgi:hypothetical protein
MGALRLGKLALLANLGPYTGRMPKRMQFRAHPLSLFAGSFLEQS